VWSTEKGPAPSLTDLAEKITKPKKIATPSPSRVQVREIGYSKKRTGVVIDPGEEVSNVSWDTGFTRAVSNKYLIKLLPDGSDDEAAKTEWQREEDEAFWRRKTKLKKDDGPPKLKFVRTRDILAEISVHGQRPRLVIGFAAETENVVENAIAKQVGKGADWIVANDVSGDVMGGHRNRVHLVTADGIEDWPEDSKQEVARRLIRRVEQEIG